jgi:hypothetical protein
VYTEIQSYVVDYICVHCTVYNVYTYVRTYIVFVHGDSINQKHRVFFIWTHGRVERMQAGIIIIITHTDGNIDKWRSTGRSPDKWPVNWWHTGYIYFLDIFKVGEAPANVTVNGELYDPAII